MPAKPEYPKDPPQWWQDSESARMAAETAKLLSESEAQKALARRYSQEERTAEFIADGTKIERDRIIEKRERELADNSYHRVYAFTTPVGENSVSNCIHKLTEWSRTDPGCDIELIINSPGGEVIAGFALIDFINELQTKGHNVTTVALGLAASMGGVILQAGDKRVMGANALLLIHEAQFGAVGSFGEVEDRVNMVKLMQQRILRLFASRSKLTVAQLERRWKRRDWWIDSDEALKHGLVDEVRGS